MPTLAKKQARKRATSDRPALKLIDTGVPGLDDVLGGGLPELSFNLIAGGPGSGKTTLAMQILFANATAERPGLYFTLLGETALKMLRYQQQFDFFDPSRVGRDVHFLNLSEEALTGDLDGVLARITEEVDRLQPGHRRRRLVPVADAHAGSGRPGPPARAFRAAAGAAPDDLGDHLVPHRGVRGAASSGIRSSPWPTASSGSRRR